MPLNINADISLIVHIDRPIILARLPVPKPQPAVSVTARQELAVRRELETAGIATVDVACELLLAVDLEVAFAVVHDD